MAPPIDRTEFIEYCLRKLGKPVITIDVDATQIEDRVDDALLYWEEFHADGTTLEYLPVLITDTDITNEFLTVSDDIIGVINIFEIGILSSTGAFSTGFQIKQAFVLGDGTSTRSDLKSLYFTQLSIAEMEEALVGRTAIRFNKVQNKLFIDWDWSNDIKAGQFVMIRAYQRIDPTAFPDVWKDQWLQRYCTALIKRQWGSNITKFEGMQLPGNIQFNGGKILDDAQAEIEKLEAEVITNFGPIVFDMMG